MVLPLTPRFDVQGHVIPIGAHGQWPDKDTALLLQGSVTNKAAAICYLN